MREAEPETPAARAIGGRRAAPPEDCGRLRTEEDRATVLEDPAHFDLAELDSTLTAGSAPLAPSAGGSTSPSAAGDQLSSFLVEPLRMLGRNPVGRALAARAAQLDPAPAAPTDEAWAMVRLECLRVAARVTAPARPAST